MEASIGDLKKDSLSLWKIRSLHSARSALQARDDIHAELFLAMTDTSPLYVSSFAFIAIEINMG